MLSNLRILHPPCSDNPTNLPTLLLCVDAQRYIFNVPEGTTRSLIQQGSMSHIHTLGNIFIPRVGVKEIGGLPGLIMSMSDAGCRQLTIHGPPVMTHYLATCRSYLRRESVKVQAKEIPAASDLDAAQGSQEGQTIYQDNCITVQAIQLLPAGFNTGAQDRFGSQDRPLKRQKSEEVSISPTREAQICLNAMFPNNAERPDMEIDDGPEDELANGDAAPRNKQKDRILAKFQGLGAPSLLPIALSDGDDSTEQGPVMLYIVRGKDIEGKVDAEKAYSLGVPSGKLLGTLKKGEDIEIARPKAWATFSAKEKSAWFSYSRLSTASSLGQGKQKGSSKRASSSEKAEKTADMSGTETEQVIVKSSDVVGESKAGFVFAQIYLPSIHYLDSFLGSSVQAQLQSMINEPNTIVHAVHPDVLRDQRYQHFLNRYKKTHHMIVSRPFLPDRLAYPASVLANLRMGHLDKNLFPPPIYNLEPSMNLHEVGLTGENIHLPLLDTNIKLHPSAPPSLYDEQALNLDHPLDSEKVSKLVSFEDVYGRKQISDGTKAANKAAWKAFLDQANTLKRTSVNGKEKTEESWPLKLTTLGTGSASPSKYRNVSGTLIHMPGKDAGYILLDAGESTYSQMARKFGPKEIDEVLGSVRLIFLSHTHGDHHMGATRLLAERVKLNVKEPLFVIAPSFVRKYLEEVNLIQSLGISDDVNSNGVILINSEHLDSKNGVVLDDEAYPHEDPAREEDSFWKASLTAEAVEIHRKQGNPSPTARLEAALYADRIGERQRTKKLRTHLTQLLHGTQVFTALMDHRISHCYGIVFRGKEWSGAYSGDTRPCDNLVKAGRGVDFLLHEATMEDDLAVMARKKGHSTFGQAIDIAKQMGVKYVILTHFSQRYAKLPKLNARDDLGDLKIGIAFDLLTLQMSDLEKMMRYREALEMLFAVDQEGDGDSESGVAGSLANRVGNTVDSEEGNNSLSDKSNGVEEVAMAVDGASISGDVMVAEQERQSLKDRGADRKSRLFQRKFVKTHEYQYISFDFKPVPSKTSIAETGTPSRLLIAQAIETSLVDLNGIVNGSFNWDLLDVKPILNRNVIQVLVKTPSIHREALRASISAGLVVRHCDVTFQARYDRTFSTLDLHALETDKSHQWMDDIVRQRDRVQGH